MDALPAGDALVGIDGDMEMVNFERVHPFGPDRQVVDFHPIKLGIGPQAAVEGIQTAAGEATGGLGLDLAFVQGEFHLFKVLMPIGQGAVKAFLPGGGGGVLRNWPGPPPSVALY